jgi:hypothetical protein
MSNHRKLLSDVCSQVEEEMGVCGLSGTMYADFAVKVAELYCKAIYPDYEWDIKHFDNHDKAIAYYETLPTLNELLLRIDKCHPHLLYEFKHIHKPYTICGVSGEALREIQKYGINEFMLKREYYSLNEDTIK